MTARPVLLFPADGHPRRDRFHHLAMLTVHARVAGEDERLAIACELRDRLLALADLPEIDALRVHVGELSGNADVLISVEYLSPVDLERVRREPRHEAVLAWYREHFEDAQRKEIDFFAPAMRPVTDG